MNIYVKLGLNENPSKQDIFDYVATKLHAQGVPSMRSWLPENKNSPVTQDANGNHCAIGMLLIPEIKEPPGTECWGLSDMVEEHLKNQDKEFLHGLRLFLHDIHVPNRSLRENEISIKANCGFLTFEEWSAHHGIVDTRPADAWYNK